MPEQGEYIYHDKFPRFLAKVESGELVLFSKLDGEETDYSGKLSRAADWYSSLKKRR